MDKKKRIEQEVEETMKAMDRLDRLEAGPYFYTRLEARLKSRQKEKTGILPVPGWFRLLKPVMMTLLVLINLVSATYFLIEPGDSSEASGKITESPLYTYVSGVTEEYWDQDQAMDSVITSELVGEEAQ